MFVKFLNRTFWFNYKQVVFILLIIFIFFRVILYILHDFFGPFSTKGTLGNGVTAGFEANIFVPTSNFSLLCPLCLDLNVCKDTVYRHELQLQLMEEIQLEHGKVNAQSAWILSPSPERWSRLEDFVCQNASRARSSGPCDPHRSILHSYLASRELLKLENLRQLHLMVNGSEHTPILLLSCATPLLLGRLQAHFDSNLNGKLDPGELAMLAVGLLSLPGYITLKLFSHSTEVALPRLLGACYHWMFLANENGHSLEHFLSHPLEVRVQLALNFLDAVDHMEGGSEGWSLFFTRLNPSHISIQLESMQPIFLNLHDFMVVDKSRATPEHIMELRATELCNELCFQQFTEAVLYGNPTAINRDWCSLLPYYSLPLMYALICKEILSPLPEHRVPGVFNYDGHQPSHSQSPHFLGLLWGLPSHIMSGPGGVEDLLRECVLETLPGGRRNAITLLREILGTLLEH